MKTLPFFENSDSRKNERAVFCLLFGIGFISTGMAALVTFPRSIRMVDLGTSVKLYGELLSLGCLFHFLANYFVGKLVDKRNCLDKVLITALCVTILCHLLFAFSSDLKLLCPALVIENTAGRIFAIFILQAVYSVASESYGKGLGYYKIAGSIGWAIFAAISGYITKYLGYTALMLLIVALSVLKLVFLLQLLCMHKRIQKKEKEKENNSAGPDRSTERRFITFALINAFFLYTVLQIQSSGGFSYLQIYLKTVLGIDEIISGYVISASGLFEIFIAFSIGRLCDLKKNSYRILVILGSFLAAVRWLIIGNGSIGLPLLFFSQFLHGVMICTLNISFIGYFKSLVDEKNFGKTIGIAGSISSLATMFAASAIGLLGEHYGLAYAYRLLGFFGVLSVLLFCLASRLSGGRKPRSF